MKAAGALLLLLLLPGCWLGRPFYSASESRPFIAPGWYRIVARGSDAAKLPARVTVRSDGLTLLDGGRSGEKSALFGIVPLAGNRHLFWEVKSGLRDATYYGVIEPAGRDYLFYVPMCSTDRAAAQAAGAKVEEPDRAVALCRFPDRASLEKALRGLVLDPKRVMWLVRIR